MALSTYMTTGGNQPAIPMPKPTYRPTTQANPFAPPSATSTYGQNFQDPNAIVQDSIEAMLNPNSSYIQNARQRGVEYAAQRGGVNSSIAAGAAERSAMEAAAPLAQQALSIQGQREQVQAQNWLDEQGFARDFQGQLAMLPVTSAINSLNALQQYALQDPELFTPEVMSGFSQFFSQNMNNTLSELMKSLRGGM